MNSEGRGLAVGGWGLSAKQAGLGMGLVFAIALAVLVGKQMSTEAMAVVIGIVCGVAASIPTALLLFVVLTRRDRHQIAEREQTMRRRDYPPVVVVQGGTQQALPYGRYATHWPEAPQAAPFDRQFHVVGGEDLLLDR